MWTAKKPKMNARGTLRAPHRASKNAFTVWKQASSGGYSGTREAAVSRRFTRIPGPGGTGKVSSVSYTEGTFVLSGLHLWFGQ